MVIGASRGLGRAFIEGLPGDGDTVVGVSRSKPLVSNPSQSVELRWIEADFARPLEAVDRVERESPDELDVIICNLGIWEETAFTDGYSFLEHSDESIAEMMDVNVTGTILLLKRLMPRLLHSQKPQLILTGSTSGLRQSGRPEVAFGASKFALAGIADALREGFRRDGLAVTCLQLGYLNTDDSIAIPLEEAAARGGGELIPMHDVVEVVRSVLHLSKAAFVREIVIPAIRDERF